VKNIGLDAEFKLLPFLKNGYSNNIRGQRIGPFGV
jgi:hypothetical protein